MVRDVARLAAVAAPGADELLLIGRRHKQDCNSWMHNSERLTKGRPRHQLLMNPGDLADRELSDGGRVRVTSRIGSVEVEVAASDDRLPGGVPRPLLVPQVDQPAEPVRTFCHGHSPARNDWAWFCLRAM